MTAEIESQAAVSISLILPVYNVAAYVEECLDSLLRQDFDYAFEIILIDDGSTDGSLEICRRFAEAHPQRIELIACDSNAGVSVARNLGLERARGEYLMFVDPDDLLPADALEHLYSAARRHDADIVKGNLVLFSPKGEKYAPDRVRRETVVRGEAVLTELYRHRLVRGHVGGKLFRREGLGGLRLSAGVRMAQDLLYFCEMFAAAERLVLIPETVYRYRKHASGSTGRKYERGSYRDWLDAVERSGSFAATDAQRIAHLGLVVRTLTQIVRETRRIVPAYARDVLDTVDAICREKRIELRHLLFSGVGPRSLIRYAKLRIALRQMRAGLSRS